MIGFQNDDIAATEIMVVDDNPGNLRLLIDILSAVGYTVRPANGGKLALLSIQTKVPDLILLDIKMPDLDGYEVCRQLKTDKNTWDIPVIFISALADGNDQKKGFDLGCVDYINKPFQAQEVVARIKNHLQIKKMQTELKKANAILLGEIAERKVIEEALAKEKERLQITLLSVGDGVISTDSKGHIEIINEVAQRLSGWSEDEARGKAFSEVVHLISAITRERCEDPVAKVIETGNIIGLANHTILISKDGAERHIADSAAPIIDEKGKISGVVLVFRDVTEDIKKQAEIIQFKEEIAFANAANMAKSKFLANMSHEIRTPMNGLLGMIQIIEMTELTEKQKEYMNVVKISSDALLRLINDILDYTKIEIGEMKLEKIVFHFGKTINDVVNLFKPSAMEKGVAMDVTIEKNIPEHFIGDPFRLRQILSNLIGNAVKFTENGNIKIDIKISRIGASQNVTLKFIVKDTGIGIPSDKIDILFKSFSQTEDSNARKYGGTGLGLAISKNLVELMGGEIWVESKDGAGSTFYFTCMLEPIIVKKDFIEPVVKLQVVEDKKNSLRILLAEDDTISQMVLEQLAGKKGWQIFSCENGTEAFNAYREGDFDVIIMDCQMPILDGYKATKAIRQLERQRGTHIPIIAMTAYALKGDREKCLEAGMDDYLTKPIHANEFYLTVEQWTKQRG